MDSSDSINAYAHTINDLIGQTQTKSSFSGSLKPAKPVNISFYPVAKNIRFIASSVAEHSRSGRKSFVNEIPRGGEESFVVESLGWPSWHPWVWSPYSISNSAAISRILGKSSWGSVPIVSRKGFRDGARLGSIFNFIDHLSALNEIFRIGPDLKSEIFTSIPNGDLLSKAIAVHVRRGDTQAKGSLWNQPGRDDQFGLSDYAQKCKLAGEQMGLKDLFVITDSDDTVEQLALLLPDFDVHQSTFDKSRFFRQPLGKSVNVEEHVRENPELADFYVSSTIGDLLAVSRCAGFVGPLATSEMSRTAYYLQIAKHQRFTSCFEVGGALSIHDPNFASLI